jgi:hypothetical protein
MLRVLTSKEELALRRKGYGQLAPGTLFDLGGERFFLTVEKHGESVTVIELDRENSLRILHDEPCVRSVLQFDELSCLNVRQAKSEAARRGTHVFNKIQ